MSKFFRNKPIEPLSKLVTHRFEPPEPLQTAVLFLVFKRPDTTAKVFEAIRKAKPPRLYVAADGSHEGREGEAEKIKKVREIATNVDWPCEIKTLFRKKNLGCKYAVSEAITWFFEHEEQGIVLEDDCLPSQSFFWYCEEMLKKYVDDTRIFLISGYNKQNKWNSDHCDYFFSNCGGIWGWASWKRAWKYYDVNSPDVFEFMKSNGLEHILGKKLGEIRQKQILRSINGDINSWGYLWAYARHKNNGLACVPAVSLIENIGFGSEATHTVGSYEDGVMSHDITIPLKTNFFFVPDREYDKQFVSNPSFFQKLVVLVKRFHKKIKVLGSSQTPFDTR